MTHVYGKNKHDENLLRSFKDGKLKAQVSIFHYYQYIEWKITT